MFVSSVARSLSCVTVAVALTCSVAARAQSDGGVSIGGAAFDGGVASGAAALDGGVREPYGAPGKSAHAGSPIAAALDNFDFGDYEAVVVTLRPLAESGATQLSDKADRQEALRIYGIACVLTGRRLAAEGAFLLLLRDQPTMHLDPSLVRPEAVEFFEQVRRGHREELLAAYRQGRPRYYMVLDILPLVGQIQNRDWKKLGIVGGLDLFFLGGALITGSLLDSWAGADHTFKNHAGAFTPLRDLDIISFSGLLGVTVYGIVDAFAVGARRQKRERQQEQRLGF
jgi:hypothetical protein